MRRFALSLLCIMICQAAWIGPPACAQRNDTTDSPASTGRTVGEQAYEKTNKNTATGGDVAEVRPSVYYLPDKNGKLQAVFRFPYEEFRELYDLKKQLAQAREPSRFVLKQATIRGTITGSRADLSATLHVVTRDDQWVRVVIGFGDAALVEPATYKGPGKLLVEYVSPAVGYVAWIRGADNRASAAPDQEHRITLPLAASVAEVGDRQRLTLAAPRTTTAPRLILQLPIPDAKVAVAEGAYLLSQKTLKTKKTEVTLLGAGPVLSVLWGEDTKSVPQTRRVIEAVSALRVTIDSRGVQTDAHLTVDNRTGILESFRIRLPEGARVVQNRPQPGYELLTDMNESKQLVEVKLAKPSSSPVEVRLTTRRPRDVNRANEVLNLAGFEVVGAARQGGHVAIAVDGDWRIGWVERRGVIEVDRLPDLLPSDQQRHIAAFEYFRKGYALSLRVSAHETHVAVEPNYLVTVESDRLSLVAQLDYNVRGAKVSEFDLQLPGWQIDKIEPVETIQPETDLSNNGALVTIPLAQRLRAPVTLKVFAHQTIESGTKEIKFLLPHPVVDALGPATVIVQPADDIALAPRPGAFDGLVARRIPPSGVFTDQLTGWQQSPLVFRDGNDSSPTRFVADFRIQPQEIRASVSDRIHLSTRGGFVEQTFSYRVSHQPTDGLILDVPTPMADRSDVSYHVNGEEVVPTIIPLARTETPPERNTATGKTTSGDTAVGKSTEIDATTSVKMRIPLNTSTLGRVRVSIRYPLSADDLKPIAKRSVQIWLAAVSEKELIYARTLLIPDDTVRVRLDDPRWSTTLQPVNSPLDRTISASTEEPCQSIQLAVEMLPRHTTVDLVWIQSWLAGAAQQNFAAYRFHTNDDRFRLQLPEGVSARQTTFWLDGRQVAPTETEGTRDIFVTLPSLPRSDGDTTDTRAPTAQRQHVVELLYTDKLSTERRGLSVDAPKVTGDTLVVKTIWQLALPENRQLIASPEGFTPEFIWGWQPVFYWGQQPILYYWGRHASIDHQMLRKISGAQQVVELPPRCNQTLFSTLGPVHQLRATTAGHSTILLCASGIVLALGLMLIYVPASRRAGVLLALAVALATSGMMFPEATLVAAQAASVGLVLAVIGGLVQRLVVSRHTARSPFHGKSSAVMAPAPTDITRPHHPGSSLATTLSVPQNVEAHVTDSNS